MIMIVTWWSDGEVEQRHLDLNLRGVVRVAELGGHEEFE